MFRVLFKARREILALFDEVMTAAEDRKITQAEVDKITKGVLAIVEKIKEVA